MSDQFEIEGGGHVAVYCGPKAHGGEGLVGLDVTEHVAAGCIRNTVLSLTREEARRIAESLLSHAGIKPAVAPAPEDLATLQARIDALQSQIHAITNRATGLQQALMKHRHHVEGTVYVFP